MAYRSGKPLRHPKSVQIAAPLKISSLANCKVLFSMTFYAAPKVALVLAAGELLVRVQSFL
jgi:hypothetical protein